MKSGKRMERTRKERVTSKPPPPGPGKDLALTTDEEEAEMFIAYCQGFSITSLAERFGRSRHTIQTMAGKLHWKEKRKEFWEDVKRRALTRHNLIVQKRIDMLTRIEDGLYKEIDERLDQTGKTGVLPPDQINQLIVLIKEVLRLHGVEEPGKQPRPGLGVTVVADKAAVVVSEFDDMPEELVQRQAQDLFRIIRGSNGKQLPPPAQDEGGSPPDARRAGG